MLRMKSVIIHGGIKMWMWLCVERESYYDLETVGMTKIGRNIVRQKNMLRE